MEFFGRFASGLHPPPSDRAIVSLCGGLFKTISTRLGAVVVSLQRRKGSPMRLRKNRRRFHFRSALETRTSAEFVLKTDFEAV
jgi:hypothetical protein